MADDPIVFASLMPHAPVLVPGVGGDRLADVAATVRAMATVARRAVAAQPGTLVLVSPHSPRRPGAFGLWRAPRLRGSLERFGSREDRVDLPFDRDFADQLEKEAARRGLRTWHIGDKSLDHGAVVPLCYLVAAGWKGPTVILSLNDPGEGGLEELGQAIAAVAQERQRRTAIIASGDMSHRLTPAAPCGFHSDGRRFDETLIALLRQGAYREVARIDSDLEETAAEDAADSCRIAVTAAGYRTDGHEVLSYEGPFGVGYGVAVLFEADGARKSVAESDLSCSRERESLDRLGTLSSSNGRVDPETSTRSRSRPPEMLPQSEVLASFSDLPVVARRAVEAALGPGPKNPPFQAEGELTRRQSVFVTLHTKNGKLRGCIGSLAPTEKDLVWETWRFAVAAASHDYRFKPVTAAELPQMRFSVTVLGELEPVPSPEELDPAIYGVVVTAADGRKGVLLPDIAGIDSVAEQLAIARDKAGIGSAEPVELQRFKAECFEEPRTDE
jgi:AmmeMemoRadiSam system protein A